MYEFIIAIVAVIVVLGPAVLSTILKEQSETNEKKKRMEEIERISAINTEYEKRSSSVLAIVRDAYFSLTRQKAAGYGPWLSACLSRPEIPPGVALEALRRVRSELTGRRFNLDGVNMAIVTLEEMTGERG